MKIIVISQEQLNQIKQIVDEYDNFYCIKCADALQSYLQSQKINGKRIKLYTGSMRKPNNYIYDDSIGGDAISENGRHQGIAIIINQVEIVFDNHHPLGVTKQEWLLNLQFYNKLFFNQEFQITEENF